MSAQLKQLAIIDQALKRHLNKLEATFIGTGVFHPWEMSKIESYNPCFWEKMIFKSGELHN